MDDAELLRSYVDQRSEEAFRELVRRHLAVVHAAAERQVNGDAHLAEDVAQRVFISLARKARALSQHRSVVGWLYTAARLEGARAVRSELRRRRREEGAAAMHSSDSPELSAEQLRPVLDEAMAELGAEEREAVLLRYFSSEPFAEIGRLLDVSEEAARKRVDRALDKLRQALGRRGIASTGSALAGALSAVAAPAISPSLTATVTAGVCQQLAAGSALPLTVFMSSTKAIAVAAGVLAVAGGLIWYDHAAAQQAEEQRATVMNELAAAKTAQAKLAAEIAALNREIADAEKPRPAPAPARSTANVAPAYLSDPEYRQVALASSKAQRHLEFQRLYRQLNLTPEQIDRFEAIMSLQDGAKLDALVVRSSGGDEQTVYKRSGPEWSNAMHELLGPDGFSQLQDYLRSRAVRAFIDGFAVQTSTIGAGITPAQSDQLAALALANDSTYQQGKGTDPGRVNWNAMWEPAAKLINADQLALLQNVVEVWSLQKQVSIRLRSERGLSP